MTSLSAQNALRVFVRLRQEQMHHHFSKDLDEFWHQISSSQCAADTAKWQCSRFLVCTCKFSTNVPVFMWDSFVQWIEIRNKFSHKPANGKFALRHVYIMTQCLYLCSPHLQWWWLHRAWCLLQLSTALLQFVHDCHTMRTRVLGSQGKRTDKPRLLAAPGGHNFTQGTNYTLQPGYHQSHLMYNVWYTIPEAAYLLRQPSVTYSKHDTPWSICNSR